MHSRCGDIFIAAEPELTEKNEQLAVKKPVSFGGPVALGAALSEGTDGQKREDELQQGGYYVSESSVNLRTDFSRSWDMRYTRGPWS